MWEVNSTRLMAFAFTAEGPLGDGLLEGTGGMSLARMGMRVPAGKVGRSPTAGCRPLPCGSARDEVFVNVPGKLRILLNTR